MNLQAQMLIERNGDTFEVVLRGRLQRGISHDVEAPPDDDEIVELSVTTKEGEEVELTETEIYRAEQLLLSK